MTASTDNKPAIRREFPGGISLVWTSNIGGAFYVTNVLAMTAKWTWLQSSNYLTALAPPSHWYVNGKLVSEPPRFEFIAIRSETIEPPAGGDASAWHSYQQRMRGRAPITIDNVNPPPQINYDFKK